MKTRNLTIRATFAVALLATLTGCSDDGGGMAPEISAPAPIVSTFEEGTDGWSGSGDFENLRTSRTNPVQGYYLYASDRATGGVWYFVAPGKFEGDRHRYYGGTFSYYMRAGLSDGSDPTGNDYFGAPDLVIVGSGMTLHYRLPASAYPNPAGFKEYNVTLLPGPSWRVESTDELATADDMLAVLGDVTRIFVRGEFFNGDDYGMIDEVYLEGPR